MMPSGVDHRRFEQRLTFARFVTAPQNRSALLAAQDVADCIAARRAQRRYNPFLLHGPSGTGKTHLVGALLDEITRRCPEITVALLSAADLVPSPEADGDDPFRAARDADVIVVEDLQHLPAQALEPFVQLLDHLLARQQQVVLTASVGPQRLAHRGERMPARLASRLAAGLVVALEPLPPEGRLTLLQDRAQRRQLAVGRDVLAWLAERLGSARELEGALGRLEALARLHERPLDVTVVAEHFHEQAEAGRVTVERIAARVGGYFCVRPEQLQSRRRFRSVLVPRQVGMYLARQLTGLSLGQIGAYFGGRDHSTVLHACRKVERALTSDAVLGGAVRQLHAELA
jgi:chromosomal replication initiator protein